MDDIRLVYIGSAERAMGYAIGHLPEPVPRLDQVFVARSVEILAGRDLPPWCHIATELHMTKDGAHAAVRDATLIFEVALSRRRRIGKAGA